MKRSCDTCEWWDELPHNDACGMCRGSPPTASPATGVGVWPITTRAARCGAWRVAERLAQHPCGLEPLTHPGDQDHAEASRS